MISRYHLVIDQRRFLVESNESILVQRFAFEIVKVSGAPDFNILISSC